MQIEPGTEAYIIEPNGVGGLTVAAVTILSRTVTTTTDGETTAYLVERDARPGIRDTAPEANVWQQDRYGDPERGIGRKVLAALAALEPIVDEVPEPEPIAIPAAPAPEAPTPDADGREIPF